MSTPNSNVTLRLVSTRAALPQPLSDKQLYQRNLRTGSRICTCLNIAPRGKKLIAIIDPPPGIYTNIDALSHWVSTQLPHDAWGVDEHLLSDLIGNLISHVRRGNYGTHIPIDDF